MGRRGEWLFELFEELHTMTLNRPKFQKYVKELHDRKDLRNVFKCLYGHSNFIDNTSPERNFSILKIIKKAYNGTEKTFSVLSTEAAYKLIHDAVIKEFSKAEGRKFI